jgi:NAD(P)-dependent dehydrogenase (short-subunit alcohol dehydrogenase family)
MKETLLGLAGKQALVTGASSGLGAHFAQRLAAHGAEVVLAARRVDALQSVAKQLEPYGRARCVALDVTSASSRAAMVEEAGPIDILVNNAGLVRRGRALNIPKKTGMWCWTPTSRACSSWRRRWPQGCANAAAGASSTWRRFWGCGRRAG